MAKCFLYWQVFLLADSHNNPRSTGYHSKLPQGGMTFHGISVLTAEMPNKSYCASVMPPGCHMASSAVNQLIITCVMIGFVLHYHIKFCDRACEN